LKLSEKVFINGARYKYQKCKGSHVIGGLRHKVLGLEMKVMKKSQMSLNMFPLIMIEGILNVLARSSQR